jgi:CPA2 family monovalent cation:H+ antiporter-2
VKIPEEQPEGGFRDHIILVGYGVTGSNLAKMLKATHLPFCVVEMNQTLVQAARDAEVPVIAGDGTRMAILEVAGIDAARVLVVAINDVQAAQRIVGQVTARRPELYTLVRTNFVAQIDKLQKLGARLVIPEDLETSIEVAAHVLRQYGVPDNIIEAQIASVRAGGYAILRGKPAERAAYRELIQILQRTTTQTFYLTENSGACKKSIAELNLRARTGCMIVAVVRNGEPTANPAPDFVLECNDVLVLVGAHRQLEDAKGILRTEEEEKSNIKETKA